MASHQWAPAGPGWTFLLCPGLTAPGDWALEGPPGSKQKAWLKVKYKFSAINSFMEPGQVFRALLCNCGMLFCVDLLPGVLELRA